MTWVKLDDSFPDHPKVVKAGHQAAWLHVSALCYAARYLTDGHLPKAQVARLTDLANAKRLAEKLVDVGLWDEDGDDYVIHDYLDFNPSRTDVEASRAAEREKKAKQRTAGRSATTNGAGGKWESRRESQGDTPADNAGNPGGSPPLPVPSRPLPSSSPPAEPAGTRPTKSEEDHPEPHPNRYEAALDHMAAMDLHWHREAGGHVHTETGFLREARRRIATEHETRLRTELDQQPGLPVDEISELIDPRYGPADNGTARAARTAAATSALIAEREHAAAHKAPMPASVRGALGGHP